MKTLRIPFTVLTFFSVLALSALSSHAAPSHAAQLASAKVLQVEGTVSKYSAEGGSSTQLKVGDILVEGDSVSATALSSAILVFSNGSEITVEENTSFNLSKLEQSPFSGNQSYEQLQADPSQSQTLLELNYGELGFHVKKLQAGSTFDIETPLGTAAIRGTQGTVKLFYNAERGEFLLIVANNDGLDDIISRYIGEFEYGRGNIGDKGFDSSVSDAKSEPIPQQHTIVIRLHRGDPLFDDLFNAYENYIPTEPTPGNLPLPTPIFTPDDPGVIIVSPEDQGPQQN
jgi:hypothetical protein